MRIIAICLFVFFSCSNKTENEGEHLEFVGAELYKMIGHLDSVSVAKCTGPTINQEWSMQVSDTNKTFRLYFISEEGQKINRLGDNFKFDVTLFESNFQLSISDNQKADFKVKVSASDTGFIQFKIKHYSHDDFVSAKIPYAVN